MSDLLSANDSGRHSAGGRIEDSGRHGATRRAEPDHAAPAADSGAYRRSRRYDEPATGERTYDSERSARFRTAPAERSGGFRYGTDRYDADRYGTDGLDAGRSGSAARPADRRAGSRHEVDQPQSGGRHDSGAHDVVESSGRHGVPAAAPATGGRRAARLAAEAAAERSSTVADDPGFGRGEVSTPGRSSTIGTGGRRGRAERSAATGVDRSDDAGTGRRSRRADRAAAAVDPGGATGRKPRSRRVEPAGTSDAPGTADPARTSRRTRRAEREAAERTGGYDAAPSTGPDGAARSTGLNGAARSSGLSGSARSSGSSGGARAVPEQGGAEITGRYGRAGAPIPAQARPVDSGPHPVQPGRPDQQHTGRFQAAGGYPAPAAPQPTGRPEPAPGRADGTGRYPVPVDARPGESSGRYAIGATDRTAAQPGRAAATNPGYGQGTGAYSRPPADGDQQGGAERIVPEQTGRYAAAGGDRTGSYRQQQGVTTSPPYGGQAPAAQAPTGQVQQGTGRYGAAEGPQSRPTAVQRPVAAAEPDRATGQRRTDVFRPGEVVFGPGEVVFGAAPYGRPGGPDHTGRPAPTPPDRAGAGGHPPDDGATRIEALGSTSGPHFEVSELAPPPRAPEQWRAAPEQRPARPVPWQGGPPEQVPGSGQWPQHWPERGPEDVAAAGDGGELVPWRDGDSGVQTIDLVKDYGTGPGAVRALAGITVSAERNRFTAIMGPSGSGKSTLLHCMAGLDAPTSGRVLLGPTDLTQLPEKKLTKLRRDRVGFVFQSYALLPQLSVRQNMLLPLEVAGRKVDDQWLRTVVDALDLGSVLKARPTRLSGGQQQRVAMARALLPRPDVVFADEPTGALDAGTAREMLQFLRASVRELGQTIVMVTHDPLAAEHTDHVLLLHRGGLAAQIANPTAPVVLDALTVLDRMPADGWRTGGYRAAMTGGGYPGATGSYPAPVGAARLALPAGQSARPA